LDNNGEILLACRDTKTIDDLKSQGIQFLPSQLELLVDWGLLEYDRKNKAYRTTIHIYGPEQAAGLRRLVGGTVAHIRQDLQEELDLLKAHLKTQDSEKSMFAVLYAYVLHSYAMEQLSEEIYHKPQLSPEKPFWNGYAWAVYPTNKFPTGVLRLPVEGLTIYRVSAAGLPRPDIKQLVSLAKDLSPDSKTDDLQLLNTFKELRVVNDQGIPNVPVFDEKWSQYLEEMAKKVYASTLELTGMPEMETILGMSTQAQAAMFLHYEIRYAFLKSLLEDASIVPPLDFDNADNNRPEDLRNMIFFMSTKQEN
jgi:hypothetical protein